MSMSALHCPLPSILKFDYKDSSSLEEAFQQALLKGEVNTPLLNGELPLHLAIRSNQVEWIQKLLDAGADLEKKDFQNLSALDHAFLSNENKTLVPLLLGYKAEVIFQNVQDKVALKTSEKHLDQLSQQMQNTRSFKGKSPLFQHVYQGEFHDSYTVSEAKQDDEAGLSLMHYAILQGKQGVVQDLIQKGVPMDMPAVKGKLSPHQAGDSLLHFASVSGSVSLAECLLEQDSTLVHRQNTQGQTALHYAAAANSLHLVEALIRKGANPFLADKNGMTPLDLLATHAAKKDPLALSTLQMTLFLTTSLVWLYNTSANNGWIDPSLISPTVLVGVQTVANWTTFFMLTQDLKTGWKKGPAYLSLTGLYYIPPLNVGYSAWTTYHVVRHAFLGLKACWDNVGYRSSYTIARNLLVHGMNSANSIHTLQQAYQKAQEAYQMVHSVGDFIHKKFIPLMKQCAQEAKEAKGEEEILQAREQCMEKWNKLFDLSAYRAVAIVEAVDAETIEGLSVLERLKSESLNPNVPQHAALMLTPWFDWEEFWKSGTSYVDSLYRKVAFLVHPDKNSSGGTSGDGRAFIQLDAAKETLNRCWGLGKSLCNPLAVYSAGSR